MSTHASPRFLLQPGGALHGELRPPGDKSISHRALLLAAIAEGDAVVQRLSTGADVLATLRALRALGVDIDGPHGDETRVRGVGLHGLRAPTETLDLGNSGTGLRLLAGLLAGQPFASRLSGDRSLSQRPMGRIIEPLTAMGARIDAAPGGCAPLHIHGAPLRGVEWSMRVASAQVKSALLLAALYARGETRVIEPRPSRDHTERMLALLGRPTQRRGAALCLGAERAAEGDTERDAEGEGGPLRARPLTVPGDLSGAAFPLVGAALAPGSDITLRDVGVNPTRTGLITILRRMGAQIELRNEREAGGEPIADLHIRYAPLHGTQIGADEIPFVIDELPALFIAAACAEGESVVTGAEELRVKESDRIQAMVDGLRALGAEIEGRPDGARIRGTGGRLGGGVIDSRGDHRIAMSFAIAALRAERPIEIRDCANVDTSFPGFADAMRRLGLRIAEA